MAENCGCAGELAVYTLAYTGETLNFTPPK